MYLFGISATTAGCYFDLGDKSVLQELNLLDATPADKTRTVGMPMIENEPCSIEVYDAAVIIASIIHWFIRGLYVSI